MIEKKKITYPGEIISLKVCDKCGRKITLNAVNKCKQLDVIEWQEFYHINFEGGYGSIFGDGEVVRVDLCQHCLKEILEHFGLWHSPEETKE